MQTKIALPAVALLLGMGAALPAYASAASCSDHMMAADNGMKADDAMAKDNSMASGDTMNADSGMKADDAMAKDNSMASGDSMNADNGMKADDVMAKDNSMADSGGMMMTDYTVKMGDSLWSIAAKTLCDGNKYNVIVKANADMIGRGMVIHPGDVLHIPGD